jgi:predicted phage terminase large subunit-like protein
VQTSEQREFALAARLLELERIAAERGRQEFMRRYPHPGDLALRMHPQNTRQTPALEAIDRELRQVAEGTTNRLMIFVPPQEGKSTRTACWYPFWRLVSDPTLRIAIVSYSQGKAARWGKWIRRMIEAHPEMGIELMAGSRAADRFETTLGGKVISVGIEGGITGESVDELIIDDPVRGRAEAESPTYREAAWEWWESNAMTRASSRFRVILMMTRWHAADLAGRLLQEEPGDWRVLRIPALREDADVIARGHAGQSAYNADGELISVQDRQPGWFRKLKELRSQYVWLSVYAQSPVAASGNLFRTADFRYWFRLRENKDYHDGLGGYRMALDGFSGEQRYLSGMTRFITMDLAASVKTSADYTVAAAWAITQDGLLLLLGLARKRVQEGDHFGLVRPLADQWHIRDVYVERGFIGTTLVIQATKAGYAVKPLAPDKDKITRALPAVDIVSQGRMLLPQGVDWLGDYLAEMAAFPQGEHDDIVDVTSYAVRVMAAHWLEPSKNITPAPRERIRPGDVEVAFESATGLRDDLDYFKISW